MIYMTYIIYIYLGFLASGFPVKKTVLMCVNFYGFMCALQLCLFPHVMINGGIDFVLCMKLK